MVYKFNRGRQGLRMREMARVKNERDGGERHGGVRGCGGERNGQDIVTREDTSSHSQQGIKGRKEMMMICINNTTQLSIAYCYHTSLHHAHCKTRLSIYAWLFWNR